MMSAFPSAFHQKPMELAATIGNTRIFFDFNSTIHESARDMMCTLVDKAKNDEDFEKCVMKEAVLRVLSRSSVLLGREIPADVDETFRCSPSTDFKPNLVFIAIDGVPPRAKMQQQRYRRFASVWHRQMKKSEDETGQHHYDWDTNAITPGTAFMHRLESYITDRLSWMEAVLDARVLLSGPNEAGEGEQKIFKFLRENNTDNNKDIVYGLDADLILQALMLQGDTLSCTRHLWICRELQQDVGQLAKSSSHYIYIDIFTLLEMLKSKYKCDAADFCFLCVLIGNDFLPRLPCISITDGGIDMLMQLRRQVLSECNSSFVTKHGEILVSHVTRFLELLVQREDGLMVAGEERHSAACEREKKSKKSDVTQSLPLTSPFQNVVRCALPGWRLRYHHHVLRIESAVDNTHGNNQLNEICACYFNGWIWAFRYTHQLCLSRQWYYPYPAAPTAMDLLNYTLFHHSTHITTKELEKDMSMEALTKHTLFDEFVAEPPVGADSPSQEQRLQLLMVLPPQSANLLDEASQKLIFTLEYQTSHMFPTGFVFEKYLKYRTWECHPLLPNVDAQALIQGLRQVDQDAKKTI